MKNSKSPKWIVHIEAFGALVKGRGGALILFMQNRFEIFSFFYSSLID